jgi:hypothetical protein
VLNQNVPNSTSITHLIIFLSINKHVAKVKSTSDDSDNGDEEKSVFQKALANFAPKSQKVTFSKLFKNGSSVVRAKKQNLLSPTSYENPVPSFDYEGKGVYIITKGT